MSRENVELVRTGYKSWNEGDIDAMLAILHPDVEQVTSGLYPGLDHVYRGHDGFRKFLRDWAETFESLQTDVADLRDGGESVVALVTFQATLRDGLEVRRQAGTVFTFRDGLAVRMEAYAEWSDALEAVGLRG
jgi:ketosteroid isomerase-like protein